MEKLSRTKKSLKNAKIALIFYFLNLILQFFYRKVFLDHLGTEYLGLNTTAMNLLQFLNLAELGVGAAVSYALYRPLSESNRDEIREIVCVQGYLYTVIGIIVAILAVILMFFFPYFFSEIKIPIFYAYLTFGVLLLSALLGYFFNYQQIVLVSDQKEYKISYAAQGTKICKVSFQIIAIYFLNQGYLWWLIIEFIFIFVTVYFIRYVVNREYPWMNTNIFEGRKLIKKYTEIAKKTKQLFAHKISAFALNQSGPLIIFAFTSLSFVAVYGNYLLVISGLTALLGAVFNSINAGIGNLVSEADKDKVLRIFDELFTIRFLLAFIACYSVYKLAPTFVYFWVGKEYLLPNTTFILMVAVMFINLTRLTVDSFINAYGLFRDIYAAIIETVLNLGLSILLGFLYGINGVLIGVLISLVVIILGWKPYFLSYAGFKTSIWVYLKIYMRLIFLGVVCFFISEGILSLIKIDPVESFAKFILYSGICIVIFVGITLTVFLMFTSGMKLFYLRFVNFLKS